MQIEQKQWSQASGWSSVRACEFAGSPQLVLAFGGSDLFRDGGKLKEVAGMYPGSTLFGCSTAGEIQDVHVADDTLAVTAVHFKNTSIAAASICMNDVADSFHAGRKLAEALEHDELVHVLVLSDGLTVNGSDLARGLSEHVPEGVTVTGGLSGDGPRFGETYVICDGHSKQNSVCVIGFYGTSLRVGFGSLGGWDPFGTERVITKSEGNVLYEMGGQSALELYKTYLGEQAADLPASGLLFPLAVRSSAGGPPVVRTILAIDEKEESMTFAGDVPEGYYARLMKANFNRLIDGAVGAARSSAEKLGPGSAELAILISCVGRKMVLKQRVEEEVEGVREVLGQGAALTGFYSYGEISPILPSVKCELHNQTMTITTFSER
ncbi:MAG: FIST C-terminal domain-containing protein [Verrucomicrobia bacterium]|nr:FIST C-terminal domain-containing protein [Verrucomicrobiota bacterium]